MKPSDSEVASALEAASVTRWLWTMKRDRDDSASMVAEAYAAYVRARAVLFQLLHREAVEETCAPAAEPANEPRYGALGCDTIKRLRELDVDECLVHALDEFDATEADVRAVARICAELGDHDTAGEILEMVEPPGKAGTA